MTFDPGATGNISETGGKPRRTLARVRNSEARAMSDLSSTTAIFLAAGMSRRFGANKLLTGLAGQPLALHAARTLRRLSCAKHIAVCREPDGEVARLLATEGYEIAVNAAPERGISSSILTGLAAAGDTSAILVCLADMPFVTEQHLLKVVEALEPAGIVSSSDGHNLVRCPPAAFSGRHFSELRSLEGDLGARKLLSAGEVVFAKPSELADIDVPSDINR